MRRSRAIGLSVRLPRVQRRRTMNAINTEQVRKQISLTSRYPPAGGDVEGRMSRVVAISVVVLICAVVALAIAGNLFPADADLPDVIGSIAALTGFLFVVTWLGGRAIISAVVSHKAEFSRIGATLSQPPVMVALILAVAIVVAAVIVAPPRYQSFSEGDGSGTLVRGVFDRHTGRVCYVVIRPGDDDLLLCAPGTD